VGQKREHHELDFLILTKMALQRARLREMFSINNLRRNAKRVDDYPEMETLPEPF